MSDRSGRMQRVIAYATVGSSVLMFRVSGRTIMRTGGAAGRLFSDHRLFRVARDGSCVVLADRGAAAGRHNAEFRVTKISGLDGDTVWSRAYRYEPQGIPGPLVEKVMKQEAASLRPHYPSLAAAKAAVARVVTVPRFFPPVATLVLGADGTIWLERRDAVNERQWWTVLNEDGVVLANIDSPLWAFRLLAVSGDVVWGAVEDADDVSYLVRLSVTRSP